jgi:outer membrane protein assembly complex protein YaeT
LPLLLLMLIIFCDTRTLMGQPPPKPKSPATLVLHSFTIAGNEILSTRMLEKDLSTKLPPSPFLFWEGLPTFRPEDLEYDVDRMKDFYRRQGFYHATVKSEVHYGPEGKVDVKVEVHEGPWVKVTKVDVEIVGGAGANLEEIKNKWPLNPGERFTIDTYDSLKKLYLNYLPVHGYPKVAVQGRVLLNEEKNTAQIHLKVETGPRCYFGLVRVKNVEKLETPAQAILEKVTFKPGDVFNQEELFKSQRNLYATDLFSSVVLTPEEVPPGEAVIPVDAAVEEKKKRSFRFGLGYGDEDKFRAKVGFIYRNLWGGGRVLNFNSAYSSLGYVFQETFTNPAVFGSTFDFVDESAARRRELPGFTDQAYFTVNRLEHNLPYDFRFYGGHGLEFARPFNIPIETLIRLQGTEPEKLYRASYLILGVRRDTVDDHINPHRGGILDFSNQAATTFFGSGLQYLQTTTDLRRYHAIGNTNFVLAGRIRFGLIDPIQSTVDVPIYRKFFAGGANSVRGYDLDLLGPRNAAGQPIGGNAVLEGSIELRFPLPITWPEIINRKIGGVIFLDGGNVFPRPHNIDLGQLKYSPGFGLRYISPIGAVGIDLAFPTNRINYATDRPYQIHFTVGYGF